MSSLSHKVRGGDDDEGGACKPERQADSDHCDTGTVQENLVRNRLSTDGWV